MKEKPVSPKLSIKEVEELTGLKVIDMEPSKNWIRLILSNGVRFIFKKWEPQYER